MSLTGAAGLSPTCASLHRRPTDRRPRSTPQSSRSHGKPLGVSEEIPNTDPANISRSVGWQTAPRQHQSVCWRISAAKRRAHHALPGGHPQVRSGGFRRQAPRHRAPSSCLNSLFYVSSVVRQILE